MHILLVMINNTFITRITLFVFISSYGYFDRKTVFVELFFIENDSDTSTEIFSTIWDGVWLSDSLKFNLYSFLG